MKKATKFTPAMITAEMRESANTVFKAMAYVQTLKPIVDGYHQAILDEMKPMTDEKWGEKRPITDLKRIYLMSDEDFLIYNDRVKAARDKAGLKVENPDFCPLLVAETLQMEAEHLFCEAMEPLTGITKHQLLCSRDGLGNLKKYLDLLLRLVASAGKEA